MNGMRNMRETDRNGLTDCDKARMLRRLGEDLVNDRVTFNVRELANHLEALASLIREGSKPGDQIAMCWRKADGK